MNLSLWLGLAALYVGLVKGGLGPVGGALLVPVLSTRMPVADAVSLTLPLLLVGDWFALPVYWRTWDARLLRLMLPAAIAGVLIGTALLSALPDDVLRRALGLITLLAVAYKLGSDSLSALRYRPHNWHGWLAGAASGFMSALANVGAPPITAYLLLQRVRPITFIGTTVLFFLVMNAVKLPMFLAADLLDAQTVIGMLWALPLIPIGVWGGKRLIERLDARRFERLMLVLLAGSGLYLLFA